MALKSSGDADSHVIGYRADIDGLRAIAVVAVVAFHFSKSALPGGFLGVDIFFVVSGFLITSIISSEAQEDQFSVGRFYDRRIRRIMPALFAMLIVATPLSVWLLLPSDLMGYGKSLLSTLGFVANIYFWRDTNYFSPAAEQKPLLHLWSLGVEEQFYIFFPLIILLLTRYWRRGLLAVVVGLSSISLATNILVLVFGGDALAFFLLPARAWELGAGAAMALLPLQTRFSNACANIAAIVGFGFIALYIAHPLGLPGLPVALAPVIGTALVIAAGRHSQTAVTRALSLPPLVFTGLISYSLYLWHWPILVLVEYYLVRNLHTSEKLVALALTALCAILSWRFVERPFRSRTISSPKVWSAAFAGGVFFAVVSTLMIASHGLPRRLGPEVAAINAAVGSNYRCPILDYLRVGLSRGCAMNLPTHNPTDADVILLGNSHAQMYAPLWASILKDEGLTGLLIPVDGCVPTIAANITRTCTDIARRNLAEVVKLPRAHIVVLGLSWWYRPKLLVSPSGEILDNQASRALQDALDDLIVQLERAGKKVVLIGPIVPPRWNLPSVLSRQLAFGHSVERPTFLPFSEFAQRFGTAIHHFENRSDIGFARPDRVQCDNVRCEYLLGGHSLFADGDHIAIAELPRFRPQFETALRTVLGR